MRTGCSWAVAPPRSNRWASDLFDSAAAEEEEANGAAESARADSDGEDDLQLGAAERKPKKKGKKAKRGGFVIPNDLDAEEPEVGGLYIQMHVNVGDVAVGKEAQLCQPEWPGRC